MLGRGRSSIRMTFPPGCDVRTGQHVILNAAKRNEVSNLMTLLPGEEHTEVLGEQRLKFEENCLYVSFRWFKKF